MGMKRFILCIYDGTASAYNQCSALGRAIADRRPKDLCLKQPIHVPYQFKWARFLPPLLHGLWIWISGDPCFGYDKDTLRARIGNLEREEIGLIIACGRTVAPLSFGLSRFSSRVVPNIQINHPRCSRYGNRWMFDQIVTPMHDLPVPMSEKNRFGRDLFVPIIGSISRVDRGALDQARGAWEQLPTNKRFPLPHHEPLFVILVGGIRKAESSEEEYCKGMMQGIRAYRKGKTNVVAICSRRTPTRAVQMLRDSGIPTWSIVDVQYENPYFASLALGDEFAVTLDSVSMLSDACATGKPVYIVDVPMSRRSKLYRFRDQLITFGFARRIGQSENSIILRKLDNTTTAAEHCIRNLGL